MIKTIKVNDNCEIEMSNNIGWALEYREQFGHDIIPDILPFVSAVLSLLGEAGEADFKKIDIKKIDSSVLQNALINLAGLQFVDFINLCWAMAKTANDEIPTPKKWLAQFEDGFYLDKVVPEVFNLLVEGLVSTKNLQSLTLAEATTK